MACEPRCLFCDGHELCVCDCHRPAPNVVDIFEGAPISSHLEDHTLAGDREDVINELTKLLEEAQRGEIRGLALVWQTADNAINTLCSERVGEDPVAFLGGISRLAHRINTEQDYLREDQDEG